MVKTKDIYWLAGLFEGEGSFSLHHPKKEKERGYPGTPVIQLKMTDYDIIQKVAKIMGAKIYGPYQNGHKKNGDPKLPYWVSQLSKPISVQWMMIFYPLMGLRRKERICYLLKYWRANCKYRGWNGSGSPYIKTAPKHKDCPNFIPIQEVWRDRQHNEQYARYCWGSGR